MTCKICEDKVYYLNVMTGEWFMCPRCSILRDAEAIKKSDDGNKQNS